MIRGIWTDGLTFAQLGRLMHAEAKAVCDALAELPANAPERLVWDAKRRFWAKHEAQTDKAGMR
jgi:hypothetical protein